MKLHFFICILLFCLYSCSSQKNIKKSQAFLNNDTLFNLSANPNDSITVHYIGCSGFFIRKGNDVVLIDPYFTYKKYYTYPFGTLTKTSTISADLRNLMGSVFFNVIKDSIDHNGLIKTILITHGHLDHYGDVPYLFHSGHLNQDTIKIIGNTTTQFYLSGDKIPDKNIIQPIEPSTSSPSAEGKWIYVNNKIRVLPIISEHAPHLRILGIRFNFVPQKNKKENVRHKYWRQYASGQTLCYLIDFLNEDGSINFRTYLNAAASNYPYGFPARSILNQHSVDIAILCVASFNNVKNYPEDIVRYLKPKHIIASHWEQFLNSSITKLKKKPKTLPGTNTNEFVRRLDAVLLALNSGITYTRPNVNTTIEYFYSNTKR